MKVVVIGGGFAGLAAAVALQERRHEVLLLERRGVLGGRATSSVDAVSGEDVDNGTHLMIGAYQATLDLIQRAGAQDLLDVQQDLRIDYRDDRGATALDCPRLRAPLHLLAGLLGLRLPWRVRRDAVRLALAVRFGRSPHGLTLAEYFERTGQGPQSRRWLWDPLATAILNERPERAAAILFYNVFREAFLKDCNASRLVFLRRGYGVLHERIARYFVSRGGRVRRRALAQRIDLREGRACGVHFIQRAEEKEAIRAAQTPISERIEADAVVTAVPWHALSPLLPEAQRVPFAAIEGWTSSPIVSVEMWLDRRVLDRAMVGLREGEVEWVFDKGRLYGRAGPPQHLAFIFSAAHRSLARSNAEVTGAAEAALRRFFPEMAQAQITRLLVLREPHATFTCDPATEATRPGAVTTIPGLYLAGDWTNTGLPATIEGAVRSGRTAAGAIEERQRA